MGLLFANSFNSMIVRLKVFQKEFEALLQQFQFYDSPIKRKGKDLVPAGYIPSFQFYDSPIKRGRALLHRSPRCKFQFYDSPIKRMNSPGTIDSDYRFQFYDSPIKSLPASVCLSILYGFNSMIVRLKVHLLWPTWLRYAVSIL